MGRKTGDSQGQGQESVRVKSSPVWMRDLSDLYAGGWGAEQIRKHIEYNGSQVSQLTKEGASMERRKQE